MCYKETVWERVRECVIERLCGRECVSVLYRETVWERVRECVIERLCGSI